MHSIWSRDWTLEIEGMGGIGDNVYQRPFVRAQLAYRAPDPVYLWTPWPELYADLAPQLRLLKPTWMDLRVQQKNMRRSTWEWSERPEDGVAIPTQYWLRDEQPNVVREIGIRLPLMGHPFVFDLPDFGPSPVRSMKPIAVVRPVSVGEEWPPEGRAPDPRYIAEAASLLRDAGYHVVAVADLAEQEWPVGELPNHDEAYLHGELPIADLMALVQGADVVVGGVGWIVPTAVAMRTPAIVIGGGCGGFNAPDVITDPRMGAGLDTLRFILPDDYCGCRRHRHDCDKTIRHFADRFHEALSGVAPAMAAAA